MIPVRCRPSAGLPPLALAAASAPAIAQAADREGGRTIDAGLRYGDRPVSVARTKVWLARQLKP